MAVSKTQVVQLMRWLELEHPRVHAGLVRRFTPRGQLSGFWDSVGSLTGSVATGVTNLVNSQGVQSLLTAATPFLQNALEKKQLQLNLDRMRAGMPVQTYAPAAQYAPAPQYAQQPDAYGNTAPGVPASAPAREVPWGLIAGGTAAVLGLMALRR